MYPQCPRAGSTFQRDCVTIDSLGQVCGDHLRPSTTREVQTICSVTSTGIKLVRYTERGRALDRAARQIVQSIEEDRACRLGEQKGDLLHHLLRGLIEEVEKDKGTSGEQLLIRHIVSFRQKYTYRPGGSIPKLHRQRKRAMVVDQPANRCP